MPSRFLRHLLFITLTLTLALGLAGPGPAAAATFAVTNCTDTPGSGLTLREAVTLAAASGDTSDTITFPAGPCIIVLTGTASEDGNVTGDIDILMKTLTVQGSGPDVTVIDGGGIDRVFDTAVGVTLVIRNLTIRNGDATRNAGLFSTVGGGIFNAGTLTLEDVALSGNQASQGGAIFSDTGASLTLTRVTINGNTVSAPGDGGGIFVVGGTGTVTVTNSTISGNTASGDGGGISTLAGSTVQLTNATITSNTANRGGGVDNSGTMTLRNTIVAGNTAGGTSPNCLNTVTSQGNNLFGEAADCGGGASDLESATPGLGPLADNGGLTQTHALLPGSPAINAGSNTGCPATDQRGIPRPAGGTCDIGAFELFVSQVTATLALNRTSARAGDTVGVTLSVSNPGDTIIGDVFAGILLPSSLATALGCPAGVAPIAFLTSLSPLNSVSRCSNAPATFAPLFDTRTIPPTGPVTVPFFSLTIPPGTPTGTYTIFLVITLPGAFDDGSIDPGDILVRPGGAFTVTP